MGNEYAQFLLAPFMGALTDRFGRRRIVLLASGYALGFTSGPVIGGLLIERWAFTTPFGVAALLHLLALFWQVTIVMSL